MAVPPHLWRFPTANAISRLSARLGVPHESSMQDWEYQIADPAQTDEYLAIYGDGTLADDEPFTLMETVLQSFEDLNADLSSGPRWSAVLDLLDRNIDLHAHSIWYWADLENESFWDAWRVSPYMRKIVARHMDRLDPQ